MESVGHLAEGLRSKLDSLIAAARQRDEEAQRAHEAKMASLPAGTCERCYGVQFVAHQYGPADRRTERCPECNAPTPHADGVPVEFQLARFDNYRVADGNSTALDRARKFMTGARDLYLSGGVGAGKTRLACTIANEWFAIRRSALFVRVPMVLHQLQPGRDPGDLEQKLFTTSLVVLDDIGAERDAATDYTRRTLLMIYEERCDRGLRTIFTSNKSVQELGTMSDDDRLSSRIAGRADLIKLSTADQRMLRRAK